VSWAPALAASCRGTLRPTFLSIAKKPTQAITPTSRGLLACHEWHKRLEPGVPFFLSVNFSARRDSDLEYIA
jgi:hypothetical protein